MIKELTIKLPPGKANNSKAIIEKIAKAFSVPEEEISAFDILKRSIDARGKQIFIILKLEVFINEPIREKISAVSKYKIVDENAPKVVIIGAGPAGLFAALKCLELGLKPIVLERGKDVRSRRRDLAALNKEGIVNAESNYCFGEGGAGTYSDGKLYTRSGKKENVAAILATFMAFGAAQNIGYDAHPHIGTNKLPQIIVAMREAIVEHGGEVIFGERLIDFEIENARLVSVKTQSENRYEGEAFILATGHSARDIFHLLHEKKLDISAKPFALGIRIEHPQQIIDHIQYGQSAFIHNGPETEDDIFLPPASYALVQQIEGKGVFSFCMCPGGIIAPAATAPGEIVVNGWSPSKRNNPFANSGIVVQVEKEDVLEYMKDLKEDDPFLFLKFQEKVERDCYGACADGVKAPAQRMEDFIRGEKSSNLPVNSYLPGLLSSNLCDVLPAFIYAKIRAALIQFGKKLKGYRTNEAIVVATESRTSSPVRIPRELSLQHPQVINLYPCGEGAGYAGGIVSAAMDGERVAVSVALALARMRVEG